MSNPAALPIEDGIRDARGLLLALPAARSSQDGVVIIRNIRHAARERPY